MVVVKRQRREKPAKIEQRTSEDQSEDLRYNKQHSWLAWLAQFTYGRPRGRRKHKKRSQGARGLSVCLSVCLSSLSLSFSLPPPPHMLARSPHSLLFVFLGWHALTPRGWILLLFSK